MLWISGIFFVIIIVSYLVGFLVSAPKYKGSVSDHFNGSTFVNPGNVQAKGLKDVIRWAMNREKEPWMEELNAPVGPKPANKVDDSIKVTFVNHSTFLIQVDGMNILTDPVWSERTSPVAFAGPKRMRPPGIRFEDLPDIDLILISHNHYDHLDVATLKRLIKKHQPKVITPLGVGAFISKLGTDNYVDMDWWQELGLSKKITLACVPAQHFSGRGFFDRDATLWCGYVFKTSLGEIYFAGDSGYGAFFKEIGQRYQDIKVALIPIGAYLPHWFMSPIHISPEEAVRVHLDVNAERSVGMHFGTFPLADDGQDRPVTDLKAALSDLQVDEEAFMVLEEGQSLTL